MYILQHSYKFSSRINRKIFILFLFFVAGLFAGIALGFKYNFYNSIVFYSSITETSFFLCFLSQIIPVLFGIIAILFSLDFIYYLLFFLDALCRGFCGAIVLSSLRSCAWLIRFLIFFPGIISSVLLIWLLIKHCNGKEKSFLGDFLVVFFLLCVSATLNSFVFSG